VIGTLQTSTGATAAVVRVAAIVCVMATVVWAQGPRRNRGEGIYECLGSNTIGPGNIWLTARGYGFVWASTRDSMPAPRILGELHSEIGYTGYASLLAGSRFLSYTRNKWPQFGNMYLGTKLTLPNNRELRLNGFGLEMKYLYNVVPFFASLGGYRVDGTGFNAEGYTVQGSNVEFKFLYDLDLIAKVSWLPLKFSANAGMNVPFSSASYALPQFLLSAGVSYVGLQYDLFAEYSIQAFNNFSGPKQITGLDANHVRIFEVFFKENPMFLSLGGRIRYGNGLTFFACVPLLLSANVGSSMTQEDLLAWSRGGFTDEKARGNNERFDPWFAKWKIVGEISYPIRYRQTCSEMMRNFLLMKSETNKKRIDIDEQLKKVGSPGDSLKAGDEEKRRRLDEIQKRREQIEKAE
jgi:hypothetical protein